LSNPADAWSKSAMAFGLLLRHIFILDVPRRAREGKNMQKTLLAAAACAALLALGACNTEPETTVVNQYDPQADALANAAPVQLPPAVTANKTYRCADNSLYYVDFYNNHTATIRTTQEGMPTMLTAADGNPPFVGTGFSVSGDGNRVTINGKSCHT
jgi:hypothetical protein